MSSTLVSALVVTAVVTAAPVSAQCFTSLHASRADVGATVVGNTAIFAGGIGVDRAGAPVYPDVVEIYDGATGSWSSATLGIGRFALAATALGQRAYFAGGGRIAFFGIGGFDTVDVYDAASGTWSQEQLSLGRWGLAATTVGGVALFAGGARSNGPPFPPTGIVDVLDGATGAWTTAALSTPRRNLAATSVGGVALFAGGACLDGPGCSGNGPDMTGFSDAVDLYDAASGTWTTASLSEPRMELAATSLGTLAFFAGGIGLAGPSARVDVYDAATGQWSIATLSEARAGIAAFTAGGYAFFAGGDTGTGTQPVPSATVDVFELATGAWHTATLARARTQAGVAVVDDVVLIGGGISPDGHEASVERLSGVLGSRFAPGIGCPCQNDNGTGGGCGNSAFVGSRLEPDCVTGLGFAATRLVPNTVAVLMLGTGQQAGVPFGDGLLALSGSLRRLAARTADFEGTASWPRLLARGTPPGPPWNGGAFRYLQAWYRDPTGPCGTGTNMTNGLRALVW